MQKVSTLLSGASALRSEASTSANAKCLWFKIAIAQMNSDALPRERTRLAVCAVKAAELAFIGTK